MFGFSLTKIAILVVAIAIVWYGMKWLQGLPRPSGSAKDERGTPDTIDLKRDETTGDYVASDPDDDRRA